MNRVRNNDRGAVAVLVAVLMAAGLVFALGAMVIDTGQAFVERAELQNGADSAATAVAAGCAKGRATCDAGTSATSLAGRYANANAKDSTTTVTLVCGRDPYKILPPCPVPPTNPLNCGPTPAANLNYAEVRTQTRSTGGTSILTPVFGHAATGENGITVHACARSRFGPPSSGDGLALTISYCEWLSYIGGNANAPVYADPPPAVPPASAERVIYFHDTNPNPTHCIAGPSGFDVPGDFGSTYTGTNTCFTQFNFDPASGTTTYQGNTGASLPGPCQTALQTVRSSHQIVFVPIYDKVTGSGGGGTYTLWSMAAFVVTGYYWPSWSANSWLTGKQPCRGNGRCISGYFTTGVDTGTSTGTGSGTGAGASIVQFIY